MNTSPQNSKDTHIHIYNYRGPFNRGFQVDDACVIECSSALPSSREELHWRIESFLLWIQSDSDAATW